MGNTQARSTRVYTRLLKEQLGLQQPQRPKFNKSPVPSLKPDPSQCVMQQNFALLMGKWVPTAEQLLVRNYRTWQAQTLGQH